MTEQISPKSNEGGFTLIEVAVASVISMTGLVFLATLFTLAIAQNKHVKQSTSSVTLAKERIEMLGAVSNLDNRLSSGGDLKSQKVVTAPDGTNMNYFDSIYVEDSSGTVSTTSFNGLKPSYYRYWKVEADASVANMVMISVRVVSASAARGTMPEETTLVTIRTVG
jgi:hypothetical protein